MVISGDDDGSLSVNFEGTGRSTVIPAFRGIQRGNGKTALAIGGLAARSERQKNTLLASAPAELRESAPASPASRCEYAMAVFDSDRSHRTSPVLFPYPPAKTSLPPAFHASDRRSPSSPPVFVEAAIRLRSKRIVTPMTRPTISASRGYANRRTSHLESGCGTADR